jgi:hypothetical protein
MAETAAACPEKKERPRSVELQLAGIVVAPFVSSQFL